MQLPLYSGWETGATAAEDWQTLAKTFAVQPCQLQALIELIPAADRYPMTAFQVAYAWASDPEISQNIKQMIYDAEIQCADAPVITEPGQAPINLMFGGPVYAVKPHPAFGGSQSFKELWQRTAKIAKRKAAQDAKETAKADADQSGEIKKASGLTTIAILGIAAVAFLLLRG